VNQIHENVNEANEFDAAVASPMHYLYRSRFVLFAMTDNERK
jgi:hypothetical protein